MHYDLKIERADFGGIELAVSCLVSFEATVDQIFEAVSYDEQSPYLEDLCPYFAHIWPAARGLAQRLAALPAAALQGKRVLELGCGLAIPSMLAARRGAHVTASDFHPDVPRFLHDNLQRNGACAVSYRAADWADGSVLPEAYDLIVASDVLYDKKHPQLLAGFLGRNLHRGATALITDPGRPWLQEFVTRMQDAGFAVETSTERTLHEGKPLDVFGLTIQCTGEVPRLSLS